jgi:hypothetical protein
MPHMRITLDLSDEAHAALIVLAKAQQQSAATVVAGFLERSWESMLEQAAELRVESKQALIDARAENLAPYRFKPGHRLKLVQVKVGGDE